MFKITYTIVVVLWACCVYKGIKIRQSTKRAIKEKLLKKEDAIKEYNKAFFLIAGSTVAANLLAMFLLNLFR